MSSLFARALMQQAELHNTSFQSLVILDNACGLAISAEIYNLLDEHAKERRKLTCIDKDEVLINRVWYGIGIEGWRNIMAKVAHAEVRPVLDRLHPNGNPPGIYTGILIAKAGH